MPDQTTADTFVLFGEFLRQRQVDSEAIYQAARYYLAELSDGRNRDEMWAAIVEATGPAEVERIFRRLIADPDQLEEAALFVLSQAWSHPAERDRVIRSVDGARGKLPLVDPELIAVVCLYGVFLLTSKIPDRIEYTVIRGPDGDLERRLVIQRRSLVSMLGLLRRTATGQDTDTEEDRQSAAAQPAASAAPSSGSGTRLVVVVDMQASGRLTDYQQKRFRARLFTVLRESVQALGMEWSELACDDRGDGLRLLFGEPFGVLHGLVLQILGRLREEALLHAPEIRPRWRMAVDIGTVSTDDEGWTGPALVHTARLVDAEVVKTMLADAGDADARLALVLSEHAYNDLVKPGGHPLSASSFTMVTVVNKETTVTAWVRVFGQRGSDI